MEIINIKTGSVFKEEEVSLLPGQVIVDGKSYSAEDFEVIDEPMEIAA